MARRQRSPTDPRQWIARAKSNLVRAKKDIRLRGVYLEDLCFDAQQAAEKAIKAVFLLRGQAFPHVHDLTGLLSRLEKDGEVIPKDVREAARLTRFAIMTRYPGLAEPVTKKEYDQAVETAEAVVRWAVRLIRRKH